MRRLAALLLLVCACNKTPPLQTAPATHRPLTVPILADGTLEPPPGGEVHAPEAGVVRTILVREGDRVSRGAALVEIANPDLDQRALASRGESAQLDEEQQHAAADLATAQRERERLHAITESNTRLIKAGAITQQQQQADDFAYRESDSKVREAQAHVDDVAKRKQIAEQTSRELASRAQLLTLRAPAAGIVYNLPRVSGENVVAGQLVATVADPQHVRVRARVDAPDLPRVRAGQRFVVTFDGLPNQKWEGAIVLVPPGLREVASREVGEVIGEIRDDASALPANASVNVEIIVGEKASALVIPRGALLRDGDTRYVNKLVDGKPQRANITVGLIGPSDVEVLSGLAEGDRVVLPGPAS